MHSRKSARRSPARAAFCFLLFGLLIASGATAQTLPGTVISNTAQLSYTSGIDSIAAASNAVDFVTRLPRSSATIDLIKIVPGSGTSGPIGATLCSSGGALAALPAATLKDGTVIDPLVTQSLAVADLYATGEPLFVRVSDADQNRDGTAVDTLAVTFTVAATGDSEIVVLSETGPNSGVFTGYVPTGPAPATAGDCVLGVVSEAQIEARYQDPEDAADVSATGALVDPLGVVFDSVTGLPVDGAIVRIVDQTTGLPASVLGDDGVSAYPAEIVSGGTATDAAGTIYQFAAGGYRFPLIAPGTYRLEIVPPNGYTAPSVVSIGSLQLLPGAPFALDAASFGGVFVVNPGPVVNIDVPLDPSAADLFLQKATTTTLAAPGDFLEYTLTLENALGSVPAINVQILDTLPLGFRLVPGSVRVASSAAADPQFGASAADLTFSLPDLAPGARTTLSYVVEVTTAVRGREALNVATAQAAGGIKSNTARAIVALHDDLFGDEALLAGRVIDGSCDDDVANDEVGVANVRIYMEDGRYAVTDEGGRYHFVGIKPGNHVVQLDLDTVPGHMEVVPCERHSRFAGRAYSQFVDLRPASLWRADFTLRETPPPAGDVTLSLSSLTDGAANEIRYQIDLTGSGVPVSGLRAMVMLPAGVSLIAATTTLDGRPLSGVKQSGSTVTFDLGDRGGDFDETLRFDARIEPAAVGEFQTKAVAQFDTPAAKRQRTPLADNRFMRQPPVAERVEWVFSPHFDTRKAILKPADEAEIAAKIAQFVEAGAVNVRAVGHTDNVRIAPQNRHEYADNYALAEDRARAVGNFVRDRLGLTPGQVTLKGSGPDEPVASNATASGRARNRRVELMIWGQRVVRSGAIVEQRVASGKQRRETLGASPHAPVDADRVAAAPEVDWFRDSDWLESATADVELLLPAVDENPAVQSLKIVAKHGAGQTASAVLNGVPVSPLNFDGVTRSKTGKAAVSRWRGVDIRTGSNSLLLTVADAGGREVARIERDIHFSGGPVRGVVAAQQSVLVADGRTRPVIALAMFDRDGKPARPDSVGVFRVDPPYRSQWQVEAERDNALIVVGDRDPVYTVGADGVARIELEPTSRTGEVTLHLKFENDREEEVRAWLKPATRDWILVGIAEGTAGYHKIEDNDAEALAAGIDDDYYQDGRLAFFAKGRVRGEYLLTLAYDTDRDGEDVDNRLFGQIDPDRFYTLYGDATEQRFDAASQKKLYVKLERGQFYALFGDFDTGLTVTELSRYSRSFSGFKSEFHGNALAYSVFAARTNQSFVKDEIRGDGTSGLYRLARRPIIVNSEKITIEVRDRFRSEDILETRNLSRHLDYDIDYLNGTLFFKQPIQTRDQNLNPVFIVADYESRDSLAEETTAGGRVSLRLGDRLTLGANAVREGVQGGEGDLYGADLKFALSDVTELRAEIATSETRQNGLRSDGDAYLVELRHQGARLDGKVYAREQDSGFGLGQQRGSEAGTRKFGFDGRLRLTRQLNINAELFQQRNLATGAVRDVAQAELRYQASRGTVSAGLRTATDESQAGEKRRSEQAFVNTSLNAFGDRVTLRAGSEVALGGKDQNIDYPTRTTVGLDYRAHDSVTVFAEHELSDGQDIDTQTTRVGVRTTPWERAQINASVNQSMTEYGPRVFANVGLVQGWQVNDRVSLDLGLDQTNTVRQPGAAPFDDDVPLASGNLDTDFTSAYFGALYRSEFWSATSRLEYRRSDEEDRSGVFFGLYREEKKGIGFSADAQVFDSQRVTGPDTLDADLRLGWAFRPNDSRWILFDRLDLRYKDIEHDTGGTETWKVINNISANYAINRATQISLRYGAKYVRSNIGERDYTGFTDLLGADWRHAINERFDVGIHGNVRHSWKSDIYDYSAGVEGGVSVADNMWVSVGYNFVGFEDDDFVASGYVAHGPYVRFRLKADQESLGALRRRLPFATREEKDAD